MAQQYSHTILAAMWCRYLGRDDEFSGCGSPGAWADPLFFGHPIGGVPEIAVPAYQALEKALMASGYHPPHGQSVWAYNKRPVAGTRIWSLHSNGIAIDIDPVQNPFTSGDPYNGWVQPEHVDAVMQIKTTKGLGLWYWGGLWSRPDRMHFQLDNRPADCQPDWDTVPGEDEMKDEDWDKLRNIVRQEIDAEFTQRLNMNKVQSNAISRATWQHKGQNADGEIQPHSMGTMLRSLYNQDPETLVREQLDAEFTERLTMDKDSTNAISRGVWQHKGENQDTSLSTMIRSIYNWVAEQE